MFDQDGNFYQITFENLHYLFAGWCLDIVERSYILRLWYWETFCFCFCQDAWSIAETDADVESNAASSRPSSAHQRAKQRPATAIARPTTATAPVERPMTAPSTRSHSQAKPEASGSSQLKSSGFHSKSSGEGERLDHPASMNGVRAKVLCM